MSLLEDVFLQDEAGEAQDLERVIEGYDDEPRGSGEESDGERGSDEAEEEKRRVDPSESRPKRVVKNPRFILNPARLTGPRGIHIIPEHFKDFKFKGKGHEKEDLDLVLKKLEHWAYRLYPKFKFEDCLKKIETLGKKKAVAVNLHKIRTDQFLPPVDTVVQEDSSDSEKEQTAQPPEEDDFDKLLQQQIDIAHRTPAHNTSRSAVAGSSFDSVHGTPAPESAKRLFQTPGKNVGIPLTAPIATSSPSISEEQKLRMIRNRQMAEEKRLARLKQNNSAVSENGDMDAGKSKESIESGMTEDPTKEHSIEVEDNNTSAIRRQRANIIDSSEDESDVVNVNQSVTVDVHKPQDIEMIESNKHEEKEPNNSLIKRNRSNVIDSTDEDEAIGVNESISVDVHCERNEGVHITEEVKQIPVADSNENSVSESVSVDVHTPSEFDDQMIHAKDKMKSCVDEEKHSVNKENIDQNIELDEDMIQEL